MSYITAQLQPGEEVLFRIKRGRKWYDYLGVVIVYFILIPFVFGVILYFLVPILGAILPQTTALLSVGGLMLLLSLALLLDLIHFLVDEIALTDRRIVGRAQGKTTLVFQKIDMPLSAIGSAKASGAILEIRRNDGKPDLVVRNIKDDEQFATKLTELIKQHT